MELTVIGTGYVGLVAGACLADLGHRVICVDQDADKVARLEAGNIPFFEPGLEEIVHRTRSRLSFTTDLAHGLRDAEVVFVAVGTPASAAGGADLKAVFGVADAVASTVTQPVVLVLKSTVPVGTADKVRERVKNAAHKVSVVSNPEFLAEGTAVDNFNRPDRIVLGYDDPEVGQVMMRVYAPLVRTGRPILHMDNRSAEVAKYAANGMLATRISFMNEVASLCAAVGADVERVRRVMASDTRIGARYLFPGAGFGGSCFPKDLRALISTGGEHDLPMDIARAVQGVNETQKRLVFGWLQSLLGDLAGKRIAIWGLAFKPSTDDLREAPAIVLLDALLEAGATVVAHDPAAMPAVQARYGDRVLLADEPLDALDGADAVAILTEWPVYRSPDFDDMRARMARPVVVDGRNLYEPADMAEAGFTYRCVGRPGVNAS